MSPTPIDPKKPLNNQKAVVTGASSGIGEACALALGAAGADVAVNYVSDANEAQSLADRIRSGGSEAIVVRADVSQEEQVRQMFAEVIEHFGTVDILINNAGLQRDSAFHEMTSSNGIRSSALI